MNDESLGMATVYSHFVPGKAAPFDGRAHAWPRRVAGRGVALSPGLPGVADLRVVARDGPIADGGRRRA